MSRSYLMCSIQHSLLAGGARPLMRLRHLWPSQGFGRLWIAQTFSAFGTEITLLAMPMTAVLILKASPAQMGLLGALAFAPFLLFGLLAGVWIDRLPRRAIMIGAALGRAVLIGSIPLAALLGLLRIEYLYVIQFLVGVLTVFFDGAYQAYLPSLVEKKNLITANSRVESTRSVASIVGPSFAGALIQIFTAPLLFLGDTLSGLFSAWFLKVIHEPEPVPTRPQQQRKVWTEIAEGCRVVFGNPLLLLLTVRTSTNNLFTHMIRSIYLLYATNDLLLSPAVIGVIFAARGIGAFIGSIWAGLCAKRFGPGPTIIGVSFLSGIASLLIPLAGGPKLLVILLLVLGQFLLGLAQLIYNINQISLRQAIIPSQLQGRMNASIRFLAWGTIPLGSLLGGALGEAIGLQPTLFIAAIGVLSGVLWVSFSPVRTLSRTLVT